MLNKFMIVFVASVAFAAGVFLWFQNKQVGVKLYHLVPQAKWERSKGEGKDYFPHDYAKDGFIHLSDGTDFLLKIANKYYIQDTSNFVVLQIDSAKISAPRSVKFEPGVPVGKNKSKVKKPKNAKLWPHLYGGGINRSFVEKELEIRRDAEGRFLFVLE